MIEKPDTFISNIQLDQETTLKMAWFDIAKHKPSHELKYIIAIINNETMEGKLVILYLSLDENNKVSYSTWANQVHESYIKFWAFIPKLPEDLII